MWKLDFHGSKQTPPLGLVRTWEGVCLDSVGRTRYFVGPIWVALCSNKSNMDVFKKNLDLELAS